MTDPRNIAKALRSQTFHSMPIDTRLYEQAADYIEGMEDVKMAVRALHHSAREDSDAKVAYATVMELMGDGSWEER